METVRNETPSSCIISNLLGFSPTNWTDGAEDTEFPTLNDDAPSLKKDVAKPGTKT